MSKNGKGESLKKRTEIGTAEAEFNTEAYRLVGQQDITYLKKKTLKSKRKRYRLCLHSDHDHLTQEMIICLNGFSYFQPHRHPGNRSESYHLIEGLLDVYLFSENGKHIDTVKLAAPGANQVYENNSRAIMYRLSEPLFHLTIPRSEWTIYHEILTGPFDKEIAVQYGDFAPTEKDTAGVQQYLCQITGLSLEELLNL
jgi:cupin fold WbuC family metalloprotein